MSSKYPRTPGSYVLQRTQRLLLLITVDNNLALAPRPRWRSLITTILIFLPIRQHIANSRTIRQFVNLLKVLLGDLKRLSRHIGNVFPHQLARIDRRSVDLLQQERPERFYAGAQESTVEGHINSFEGDGSEAALQVDGLGF